MSAWDVGKQGPGAGVFKLFRRRNGFFGVVLGTPGTVRGPGGGNATCSTHPLP